MKWTIILCYIGFTLALGVELKTGYFNWFYYIFNAFIVISVLLYLPIALSIFKVSHLQSVQVNHPQRYILWQLIPILILKISYIIVFFLLDRKDTLERRIMLLDSIDSFAIPFIFEISYLGCNRRNLMTLLGSFRFRRVAVAPIERNSSTVA
uniref:Serpentine receptor class gamma n=1 Tax=Caenorhabditis tropicalis TaxID=1561998 RepID=A0A1I7TH62_9PELO